MNACDFRPFATNDQLGLRALVPAGINSPTLKPGALPCASSNWIFGTTTKISAELVCRSCLRKEWQNHAKPCKATVCCKDSCNSFVSLLSCFFRYLQHWCQALGSWVISNTSTWIFWHKPHKVLQAGYIFWYWHWLAKKIHDKWSKYHIYIYIHNVCIM